MKKRLAIIASVALIAMSFAACSSNDKGNTDTSSAKDSTTSVSETASSEEDVVSSDEQSGDESKDSSSEKGGPPEGTSEQPIKEIPMDDAYLAKILTLTDKPTCAVDGSVTEDKYIGTWECEVAVNGDTAYSSIFGIPLYASDRIEVKDDKTGSIISTTGGKDGAVTTTSEFTWAVADGTLTADIKGAAGGTYQVAMHMSDDGRIMLISKARDGSDVSAYYRSVDGFTDFDFSSVHFDYAALSS